MYYCGNLTAAEDEFSHYPINTDDRPVIEYTAPVTQRRIRAGEGKWFKGRELLQFMGHLRHKVPLTTDPYLIELQYSDRQFIEAGYHLFRALYVE